MSTENIFETFEKYDFENDSQFKAGVASLLNNKQENETELLEKAKLFYYSKFITPVDPNAYKEWKENRNDGEKNGKEEEQLKKEGEDEKPPRFTFQELVDMIEKGIEIPGIRQIPNKLNEGTPSESKMAARPKPWEINKE